MLASAREGSRNSTAKLGISIISGRGGPLRHPEKMDFSIIFKGVPKIKKDSTVFTIM